METVPKLEEDPTTTKTEIYLSPVSSVANLSDLNQS
jgi:hypothetical protein